MHREYLCKIYNVAAEDERRMHDTFYSTLNIHWGVVGGLFVAAAYGYSNTLPVLGLRGFGIVSSVAGLLVSLAAWSGLKSIGRAYRRLAEAICFRAQVEEQLHMAVTRRFDQPEEAGPGAGEPTRVRAFVLHVVRVLGGVRTFFLHVVRMLGGVRTEFLLHVVLVLGLVAPLLAVLGLPEPGLRAAALAMLFALWWQFAVWNYTRKIGRPRVADSGAKDPPGWSHPSLVPYRQAEYRRSFPTPHAMYASALIQDSPYTRARFFFLVVSLLGFATFLDGLRIVIKNAEPVLLPSMTAESQQATIRLQNLVIHAPASASSSTAGDTGARRP